MKIVHVSDAFAPVMGGIETQVAELASQQAKHGDDITVMTTTLAEPQSDQSAKGVVIEEPTAEVPYRVIRSEWPNVMGLPVDPHAPKRFLKLIEDAQPDVVHVHLGEVTPVATDVLIRLCETDIPVVATIHSIWSRFPTVPAYRVGAKLVSLDDAPILWLPNSELTAGRVRKVVDPELVRVQNNSVDAAGWVVEPVPHEGLVAVTATRFAPRKRVPELLELLKDVGKQLGINSKKAKYSAQDVPLRVVIAGEGPGLESAQKYVQRHGMSHWVSFPGRLDKDELVRQYARSDIYLSPSVKDAFSISGLEARASGLAILARSQSGFGAAVLDDVEGRAVDTDEDMAQVLVDWVHRPEKVEAYKSHNREVPMPYTWETAIPQFKKHYEDAAGLRARATRLS